jgi:ABC-type transport system substrate-binding protein
MRRNVVFVLLGLAAAMAFIVACGGTEQVIKEVEVEKIVTVEVVKEVIKEVPITTEKVVEVPVIKTVVATPTAGPVVAKTGTIPGSKLRIALQTIGGLVKEPRSNIVLYGCRPGCLPIKDDFFLFDTEWTLQPHVVKSWDFGSDTKSWTLNMQEGIEFWDGTPATIEDLEFSIFEGGYSMEIAPLTGEKLEGRPLRWSTSTPFIDHTSKQIVDSDTLKIEFPLPTIGLPQLGLTVRVDSIGLRPKNEILERGWADFLADPNLSGAYIPTKSVPGEIKEYDVNVNWFKGAPDFAQLTLLEAPEGATRVAMLAVKQADMADISAVTLPQALKFDNLKIIEQANTMITQSYFGNIFNPGDPGYDANWPFNNIKVREAFNIAIDRDLIIQRIYQGKSRRYDAPAVAPGMAGWDEPQVVAMRNNPIPFDPARARRLLAEAKFPMDMEIVMSMNAKPMSGVPELGDLNEALLTQWRNNLGLNVTLKRVEATQEWGPQRNNKEKVNSTIWAGERTGPSPTVSGGIITNFFTENGWNFFLPKAAELKALYDETKSTTDIGLVARNTAAMSQLLRDEWAFVPLTINPLFFAAQRDKILSYNPAPTPWPSYFEHIKAVR